MELIRLRVGAEQGHLNIYYGIRSETTLFLGLNSNWPVCRMSNF